MKTKKRFIVVSLLALLCILVVWFLAGLLIRHPVPIDYEGQAMEYSPIDASISIHHEVIIKGTYNSSPFGRDHFQGTFYISDIEGIGENEDNADFNLNPKYRYCPVFLDDAGQPSSSQVAQILFDKGFRTLSVQFASQWSADDNGIHTAASDTSSHFLVLNAPDRESALSQYTSLLNEKILR